MLDFELARLADLKRRLGIATNDITDDVLLNSVLDLSSALIESAAGRTLRRDHARVETFPGGKKTVRLSMSPIAKVHSIRESETGDFETAANYEELVEGTDFIIDGGDGGDARRTGESGVLRRLDQNWESGADGRMSVRVVYTAGYKTDGEVAAENGVVAISAGNLINRFIVRQTGTGGYEVLNANDVLLRVYAGGTSAFDEIARAFFRFSLISDSFVLPVWSVTSSVLAITATCSSTGSPSAYVLSRDPLLQGDISGLFASPLVSGAVSLGTIITFDTPGTTNDGSYTLSLSNELAILALTAIDGFVAFSVCVTNPNIDALYDINSPLSASGRPILTIRHGLAFTDPFTVPDDLRQANIVQAVAEYQTRNTPGFTDQAMRGVSIASGASYKKPVAGLLPEVKEVAMRYRRLY